MKKDRLLRLCVTAALMAGGVWSIEVPGVSAKTFDMTSGKYANGITYMDPDSGVGTASDPNCYNYKYDATSGKIIGGNVKVESNENGLNFYTALRISKSDLVYGSSDFEKRSSWYECGRPEEGAEDSGREIYHIF